LPAPRTRRSLAPACLAATAMRVLMITTEFPCPESPGGGIFVARRAEALRRQGVEIDVLAFRSRANPLAHVRAWRRMRAMLAAQRYDLIHAQFGHSALPARGQSRLPVVVTFRGEELQGIAGPDGRWTWKGHVLVGLSQLLAFLVDEVIVVSERMQRRLLRRCDHVIPSGLDLDRFVPLPRDEARRRLGWPLEPPVVLFAAQDVHKPIKRYSLARAAYDLAARSVPGAELRVATGLAPNDVPLWLAAADVLLMTSVQEGSPNVVKEALACNLPVVSVDIGDVRERVHGVDAGAVCDATPEALAAALVPLLARPVRSNGRRAVRHLDDATLARQVLGIYEEVLARRGQLRIDDPAALGAIPR